MKSMMEKDQKRKKVLMEAIRWDFERMGDNESVTLRCFAGRIIQTILACLFLFREPIDLEEIARNFIGGN